MIHEFIYHIRLSLVRVFSETNTWFQESETIRSFKERDDQWSVNQVLEHIVLTNHYLLMIIDKGRSKALQRDDEEVVLPEDMGAHLEKLDLVGIHKSFDWHRPEHMEPRGTFSEDEIRYLLRYQLQRCIYNLEQMKSGEGFKIRTTMTVNNLGKIDVYQYLYFLVKHIERHLSQMQELKVKALTALEEDKAVIA